jgi:hypothetical protein
MHNSPIAPKRTASAKRVKRNGRKPPNLATPPQAATLPDTLEDQPPAFDSLPLALPDTWPLELAWPRSNNIRVRRAPI